MTLITIGEFAERTRLSAKALRLYDELGLVVPARVDPSSGYRLYADAQVETARLVGLLRRLDMPLVLIAAVLKMEAADAARAIADYWGEVEATTADRRALVAYLRARLIGEQPMYDIQIRTIPERKLLTINRHVHAEGADEFFHDAFSRLRAAAPGIEGIAGAPFLVFYGEVSADSDGPMEVCRPVDLATPDSVVEHVRDAQLLVEPEHDEAYVRLAPEEIGWPAMLPAWNALTDWVTEHQRQPAGALRQILMAGEGKVAPENLLCDLAVPLR